LTVLGVIVIVFGVLYAIALARSTAQLRRAYAALEADGRPMRAADVILAEVPDTENAAVLYRSAVLMLKGQPAGEKSLYERLTVRSLRPKAEAEMNELIGRQAVAEALALVEQGTRRPTCRLEHDNDDILEVMDAPPLEDIRNLGSVLTARARFEARTGNATKAWDLILTQLRLADSLRGDPSSSTQFLRLTLTLRATRTMQWLCETALPDRQRAQALEDLLKRQEDLEPLVRAADGERLLIGEWFFHLPRRELDRILWKERENSQNHVIPLTLQKVEHRLSFLVLAFKPRLVADHAAYLEFMRKRIQLLQGPYRDRKESDAFMQMPPGSVLTDKLTWRAGNEKWFYTRYLADLRVVRAGLALLQYEQAHDTFPETLDALSLEGLIDPYTEKPLFYRPQGAGFAVYSVGDDRKDNGGVPQRRREESDPRRKPIEYDQVWRFPNPENQAAGTG
jgi:hypothetical protein